MSARPNPYARAQAASRAVAAIGASLSLSELVRQHDWLDRERALARALIGSRVGSLEAVVGKLAKETPYPFRLWWPRVLARMARGETAVNAYDAEIANMRDVHARRQRLA